MSGTFIFDRVPAPGASGEVRRRSGRAGGFTLIEVTLVLFVIGIMMAVAFPKFRNISGGDIKGEARTLIGQVQGLYGEATFTRRAHRLVFDLDGGRYWGEVKVGDKFQSVARTFLKPHAMPRNVSLRDVTTPRDGKRSDGTTYAYFHPLGRVDFTTIHLETEDGDDVLTLELNPINGKVKVTAGDLETSFG
ncbi:MAG: Tfp pilus assembly protein FimT/FimU [Leptospirillia bacterium]